MILKQQEYITLKTIYLSCESRPYFESVIVRPRYDTCTTEF